MRLQLPSEAHYYLDFVCQPEHNEKRQSNHSGVKRYVFRNGQLVMDKAQSRDKAPHSNWGGHNVDPDALKRHNAQLRRFHFLDRGVPPPRGPVW